jgi:hypothetical protein
MRIFSGIRASGAKTLGNYSGGFRQYAATQEQGEAFFCIVDLHSITTPFEPGELREATLDRAVMTSSSYLYQTSAWTRESFTPAIRCAAVSQTYRQRAFAVPPDASELIVIRPAPRPPASQASPSSWSRGTRTARWRRGPRAGAAVAERLRRAAAALFVTPLQRTAQREAPCRRDRPPGEGDPRPAQVHLGDWEAASTAAACTERGPIAMQALIEERWDAIPAAETMDSLAARVGAGTGRDARGDRPRRRRRGRAARRRDRRGCAVR